MEYISQSNCNCLFLTKQFFFKITWINWNRKYLPATVAHANHQLTFLLYFILIFHFYDEWETWWRGRFWQNNSFFIFILLCCLNRMSILKNIIILLVAGEYYAIMLEPFGNIILEIHYVINLSDLLLYCFLIWSDAF